MAIRVRRSVLALGDWSSELEWYGKAVTALLSRPLNDPTGWRYMAAVHGRMQGFDPYAKAGDKVPPDSQERWNQCQHQTWFFLPWHRGYLAAFEATVAKTIADLGGPQGWALPYWDYSASAASRIMPKDFYMQKRPDGSVNPLWNRWSRPPDGKSPFTNETVSIECLRHSIFAGSNRGGEHGFGGPATTGFAHFGQLQGLPSGRIEEAPHNLVHGAIGGLMGDPDYAALDPIFWLHHANIDRLWEVWRKRWPNSANPSQTAWLNRVSFELNQAGQPYVFKPADVLDTSKVLHGYSYDMPAVPAGPEVVAMAAMGMERHPGTAELAGSNEDEVSLAGGEAKTRVVVRPRPPERLQSVLSAAAPLRTYLNLENITGQGMPGNYEVYVSVPGKDPVLAGVISTFGIAKASSPDGGHGGNGLTRVVDITPLSSHLGLGGGNETALEVTIKKAAGYQAAEALPLDTTGNSVKVGRVSVYFA